MTLERLQNENDKYAVNISYPSRSVYICFNSHSYLVEASWTVMAHAQKPDFVFRAKRTSPFKSARLGVRQFSRLLAAWGVRMSGSNARYTMFRGSVKITGYPLHSPVSPFTSLPVRHRVPSRFNRCLSTGNSCTVSTRSRYMHIYILFTVYRLAQEWMPLAKEIFPLAILGARAVGSWSPYLEALQITCAKVFSWHRFVLWNRSCSII